MVNVIASQNSQLREERTWTMDLYLYNDQSANITLTISVLGVANFTLIKIMTKEIFDITSKNVPNSSY